MALTATQQADCTDMTRQCRFAVGDRIFTLTTAGHLSLSSRDTTIQPLRLPVPSDFEIDRVFRASIEADVLIAYEVSDGEVGAARVVRVRNDGASLKQLWAVDIPAFNLSEGVLEGPWLYQAALGFVARIDLRHGTLGWKHEGLYDSTRQAFGSFQRPIVGPNEVQFIDDPAPGRAPARVVVNKQTGVMRVE